jgi:hypothetical protein
VILQDLRDRVTALVQLPEPYRDLVDVQSELVTERFEL